MSTKLGALLGCLTLALAADAFAAPRLAELGWLAGTWKREGRGGTLYEIWTKVGDRTLEGRSYQATDGGEKPLEALRLAEMDGEIFYISKVPENAYPIAFRLTALEGKSAVFENPTHDFPTRISYALREDGKLLAAIEGPGGPDGATRKTEWVFVRE